MIPARALLRRRSPQLRELRARLREERARTPSSELRAAASELLRRKLAVSERIGQVAACSGCAVGMDGKAGTFDGGLCCSGNALDVFAPESIAAMAITGTRPRHWVAATDAPEDARGCVFRSGRGCTLEARHRPSLCVHYVCQRLMGELAARGDARAVAAAQDELAAAMRAFAALYERDRLDDELETLVEEARRERRPVSSGSTR